MPRINDLTGKRFGRLVVLSRAPNLSPKNTRWKCLCDCGKEITTQAGALRSGGTKSCGCLQRDTARKHGMEKTLTYTTWAQMKSRCTNPKHRSYKNYGGRGIDVCDRWLEFENFLADMGEKPLGKSLDRIDNDKGYSPENCRWADNITQCNNKGTNRVLEYAGRSMTVTQWGDVLGISPITIRSRLNLGWSIEKALITKVDSSKATKRKK